MISPSEASGSNEIVIENAGLALSDPAMVGSATLAIEPSITAITSPSAIVKMAQLRCGWGRPSACSIGGAGIAGEGALDCGPQLASAFGTGPIVGAVATQMIADRTRILPPAGSERRSAFAQQFVDPALQLALFRLALAKAFVEVGFGQNRGVIGECDADEIVAPPNDLGHERAALARDRQRELLLREPDHVVELDAGALLGNIADHARRRRAGFARFGNPAVKNLLAPRLASILHH